MPPKSIILYFQIHQPRRLRKMAFMDVGRHPSYFDDDLDGKITKRIAEECYVPATEMLLDLCKRTTGVKLTYSVSGVALHQLEHFSPEVLTRLRALCETGCVEMLGETSHHSLSCTTNIEEFKEQVMAHKQMVAVHFGMRPEVFRNTELIYHDRLAGVVSQLGYKAMLCDDGHPSMASMNTHRVYKHPATSLGIVMRNNNLSDDIAFRFVQNGKTLDVHDFVERVRNAFTHGPLVTLGFDYETFGEHMKKDTGIINFLHDLIDALHQTGDIKFAFPSEVNRSTDRVSIPVLPWSSWADKGKDLSAWCENEMQTEACRVVYGLASKVKKSTRPEDLDTWRHLQTSDHFYYMSTKHGDDGRVHEYFSPYSSPYEAYINYMNVLQDFEIHLDSILDADAASTTMEYERRHPHMPRWAREEHTGDFSHNSILER